MDSISIGIGLSLLALLGFGGAVAVYSKKPVSARWKGALARTQHQVFNPYPPGSHEAFEWVSGYQNPELEGFINDPPGSDYWHVK